MIYNKGINSYVIKTAKCEYLISQLDILNPLGKGAFGIVYKCTLDSNILAVKQLPKNSTIPIESVKKEIQVMISIIKQPESYNLVQLIDYTEDDNFFYLIMPFYDKGSLTQLINLGIIKSEIEAIEYFRQICYGMRILHNNSIIHRDLKTDNILISSYNDSSNQYPYKYLLNVGDFGLSKHFDLGVKQTIGVGTANTNAPEVTTGFYDTKADIYSLGCIFYKMLTQKEPFQGSTILEVVAKKESWKELVSLSCFGQQANKFVVEIINGCLQLKPEKRWSSNMLFTKLDIDNMYPLWKPLNIVYTYAITKGAGCSINGSISNHSSNCKNVWVNNLNINMQDESNESTSLPCDIKQFAKIINIIFADKIKRDFYIPINNEKALIYLKQIKEITSKYDIAKSISELNQMFRSTCVKIPLCIPAKKEDLQYVYLLVVLIGDEIYQMARQNNVKIEIIK